MSVGLLVIAHEALGDALLQTAIGTFGQSPTQALALSVPLNADPETSTREAAELVNKLDRGEGVLVLTDLYGSTPCNVACRLAEQHRGVHVVAGVNLPMLIRVLNYATLDLDALAKKAFSGGRDGVIDCSIANGRKRQRA